MYETLVVKLKAVTPSEFWKLTPNEAQLFLENEYARFRQNQGRLTDQQIDDLEKRRQELEAQGVTVL